MIRAISSFADGPANFNPTSPAEVQAQKLISSIAIWGCHPQSGFSNAHKACIVQFNHSREPTSASLIFWTWDGVLVNPWKSVGFSQDWQKGTVGWMKARASFYMQLRILLSKNNIPCNHDSQLTNYCKLHTSDLMLVIIKSSLVWSQWDPVRNRPIRQPL